MGKAPKTLSILLTHESMFAWPEVRKLAEQGHTIAMVPSLVTEQLILGPNCWMMDEELRKYLPMAVKAARERVYSKKGVEHNVLQDSIKEQEGGGKSVDGDEGVCTGVDGESGGVGEGVTTI